MELSERAVCQYSSLDLPVQDESSRRSAAKYYVAASLVALVVFLVWKIGYPFVIVCALTGTALALTTIVVFTAADLFMKKKTPATSAKRK